MGDVGDKCLGLVCEREGAGATSDDSKIEDPATSISVGVDWFKVRDNDSDESSKELDVIDGLWDTGSSLTLTSGTSGQPEELSEGMNGGNVRQADREPLGVLETGWRL